MSDGLFVHLLADRPDLVAALAAAYERQWPDWYRPGHASAADDLRARRGRDGLPLGLVAVQGDMPVGACALVAEAGPIESDDLPWLGGLWVDPGRRRRGIAEMLVGRALTEAARLGFPKLHASTQGAAPLFHALGWRLRETRHPVGGPLAIFERSTV